MENPQRSLTPQDEQAALMIAVLMFVSKMNQQYTAALVADNPDAGAEHLSQAVVSLMRMSLKMFPAGDMEQQVLAFARTIGFEVEQQRVALGSQVPQ